ncbi:MAG: DUF2971 domain-containing protein [Dysgonamonadaceae bacterium]|jgi:hypothetical protein|nr:DUF2971 domain-containing protein [Dysgonamonadaceae bacterium]
MTPLYHFTSYDTLLKILEDNSLKFGDLNNTNDPKEYIVPIPVLGSYGRGKNRSTPYKDFEAEEQFALEHKKYRLLCFSEDDDCSNYNSPRMWAQYANRNSGCCLIIDKEKFEAELAVKFPKAKFGIVNYENQIKDLSYFLPKSNLESDVQKYFEDNINYLFFEKSKAWESEKEYRAIIRTENDNFVYIEIYKFILGIIFGDRFPHILKSTIIQHFDNHFGDYLDNKIIFKEVNWLYGINPSNEAAPYQNYHEYLWIKCKKRLNRLNAILPESIKNDYKERLVHYYDILEKQKTIEKTEIENDLSKLHAEMFNFEIDCRQIKDVDDYVIKQCEQ